MFPWIASLMATPLLKRVAPYSKYIVGGLALITLVIAVYVLKERAAARFEEQVSARVDAKIAEYRLGDMQNTLEQFKIDIEQGNQRWAEYEKKIEVIEQERDEFKRMLRARDLGKQIVAQPEASAQELTREFNNLYLQLAEPAPKEKAQ